LEYKHTAESLPPGEVALALNALLEGFCRICPGLDVVIIGFADADETPPELSLVSFAHYAETKQKQQQQQRRSSADNGERPPD
jgi:hypothetical protein